MKKVISKLHPGQIGVIKTFSLSPADEIGEIAVECTGTTYYYNNLKELCRDWEDCENLDYWYIDSNGNVMFSDLDGDKLWEELKDERESIGNYFETKEEAEKAVKKLKAWKRLKNKKFKFRKWRTADIGGDKYYFVIQAEADDTDKEDLDLLFGGEE